MKVTGEAVLHAPVGEVWRALNDPSVLVQTIPGCERLESTGPDTYRMVVNAGVGSIKGTYAGEVALTDQREPNSFLMIASGSGAPGAVSTEVRVRLDDAGDGATRLTYDADAEIAGPVAGVGQRMLAGVAKKMAGDFFRSVDAHLTGATLGTTVGRPPADGVATPGPASPAGVFVAPPRAAGGPSEFVRGALVGAAIALAGVVVGGLLARRRR